MNRQTVLETKKRRQSGTSLVRNPLERAAIRSVDGTHLSAQSINSSFNHDFSQIPARTAPVWVQAKLEVNQPGDKYEQEADRVAEQVMRIPESQAMQKPGVSEGSQVPCVNLQRGTTSQIAPSPVPPIVHEVLHSSGQLLDPATRAFMETRFSHDFGRVRVHTDEQAAKSARAVKALAYTVGSHVVFGKGQYKPGALKGRQLLAHELVHTVQQGTINTQNSSARSMIELAPSYGRAEAEADQMASRMVSGYPIRNISANQMIPTLQQHSREGSSSTTIRSPVFEELVTQVSTVEAGVHGRALRRLERELARGIFANSIDYNRIRLIPTRVLQYRTVGNTIRVPRNFTINNRDMAQTFIHEMTHVWQYQHTGTSYISRSLGDQIAATMTRGNRSFAYDYRITSRMSFFDLRAEQQAFLVENYFAMLRDRRTPCNTNCLSNHLDITTGFRSRITQAQRQAEIARELPQHQRLIRQMQAALPRQEINLLGDRARDVMSEPHPGLVPEERRLLPVRPIFEIRF